MKLKLTLLLSFASLFSLAQTWKDISQGLHFTDYIYFNNTHFGINISNSGSSIYKLSNNKWNRIFFGTITDCKIWGNKFVVAGNFIDSFNLRFFEDDAFKPLLKTNTFISSISAYGDSLLVVEGQTNSTTIRNNIYWFFNNQKININFSFNNSRYIPVYLSSAIVIKDKLYSGGNFRTYYYEPNQDTMNLIDWSDIFEINLNTFESKIIHKGSGYLMNSIYKTCSYRDTLSFIEMSNFHFQDKWRYSCITISPNLPFGLCQEIEKYNDGYIVNGINPFQEENDTLFQFDKGILKRWYNGNATTIINDSLGIIVSISKNKEGFFAIDRNGKIFHYSYSGATAGINSSNHSNIKIYPNPASDKITINTNEPVTKVKIYSCTGNLVIESKLKEVNISSLNAGIYFIVIDENTPVEFFKINY